MPSMRRSADYRQTVPDWSASIKLSLIHISGVVLDELLSRGVVDDDAVHLAVHESLDSGEAVVIGHDLSLIHI